MLGMWGAPRPGHTASSRCPSARHIHEHGFRLYPSRAQQWQLATCSSSARTRAQPAPPAAGWARRPRGPGATCHAGGRRCAQCATTYIRAQKRRMRPSPVKISNVPLKRHGRGGASQLAYGRAAECTGGQGAGAGWGFLAFPLLFLLRSLGGAGLLSRHRRELVRCGSRGVLGARVGWG